MHWGVDTVWLTASTVQWEQVLGVSSVLKLSIRLHPLSHRGPVYNIVASSVELWSMPFTLMSSPGHHHTTTGIPTMKTAADWAVTESRATVILHRYLTASGSEESGDSEEDETQTCDRAPSLNHLLSTGDVFDPRPRRGSTEEQGDRLK